MKTFMKEFKAFIAKGNVMSLAIGIIIGGAFTSIVTSLVNDIITPLIGIIIGGINFSGISITVGGASLLIGNFIQSIINFLLTALVLFLIMKALNRLDKKEASKASPAADILLLTEIRDLLKKDTNNE